MLMKPCPGHAGMNVVAGGRKYLSLEHFHQELATKGFPHFVALMSRTLQVMN